MSVYSNNSNKKHNFNAWIVPFIEKQLKCYPECEIVNGVIT